MAAVTLGLAGGAGSGADGRQAQRPTEKPADPEAAKPKAAADRAYKAALRTHSGLQGKIRSVGRRALPADNGKKPK